MRTQHFQKSIERDRTPVVILARERDGPWQFRQVGAEPFDNFTLRAFAIQFHEKRMRSRQIDAIERNTL